MGKHWHKMCILHASVCTLSVDVAFFLLSLRKSIYNTNPLRNFRQTLTAANFATTRNEKVETKERINEFLPLSVCAIFLLYLHSKKTRVYKGNERNVSFRTHADNNETVFFTVIRSRRTRTSSVCISVDKNFSLFLFIIQFTLFSFFFPCDLRSFLFFSLSFLNLNFNENENSVILVCRYHCKR